MNIVIPPHFVNISFAKNPLLLSVHCWILLAPWSRPIFRLRTLRMPRCRNARKRSPSDNANHQQRTTSEFYFGEAATIATFSNEDENEDEDWYDRLGPGTRTSSTTVFRRETKTFSKPVTVRGRVSSYSESHQGKCLSKNFVTSLYFSTAIKLFPMKSFCYFR